MAFPHETVSSPVRASFSSVRASGSVLNGGAAAHAAARLAHDRALAAALAVAGPVPAAGWTTPATGFGMRYGTHRGVVEVLCASRDDRRGLVLVHGPHRTSVVVAGQAAADRVANAYLLSLAGLASAWVEVTCGSLDEDGGLRDVVGDTHLYRSPRHRGRMSKASPRFSLDRDRDDRVGEFDDPEELPSVIDVEDDPLISVPDGWTLPPIRGFSTPAIPVVAF